MVTLILLYLFSFLLLVEFPNYFSDSVNSILANPLVTPEEIVPEWYILPFYSLVRAIPQKIFGVIAMIFLFLILLIFPFISCNKRTLRSKFYSFYLLFYGLWTSILILFGWLGKSIVEEPYLLTTLFLYLLVSILIFVGFL